MMKASANMRDEDAVTRVSHMRIVGTSIHEACGCKVIEVHLFFHCLHL